ncbi:MAG: hypothetical protein AUJ98_00580 [Bacteroidetes bacterium CG2_30_33_31]|nr:MAG: hypothetical protein AUJ98_00580 [Bacteroidetes bacterium CG2_30_33_31]
MKFLSTFVFLLAIFSNIYAQEIDAYDSLSINQIDTNYAHNFGFTIGGGVSFPVINPIFTDTFSNWRTEPGSLISIGMLYNSNLNKQLSLQCGLILNFTKIPIFFTINNNLNIKKITNYSSLAIPFFASYKLNQKKKGLFFTFGAQAELDISKKIDKDNRMFPLKAFVPELYSAVGYKFNNIFSIYELRMFWQIIPINILKLDNEIYSHALASLIIWRTGILFTIR